TGENRGTRDRHRPPEVVARLTWVWDQDVFAPVPREIARLLVRVHLAGADEDIGTPFLGLPVFGCPDDDEIPRDRDGHTVALGYQRGITSSEFLSLKPVAIDASENEGGFANRRPDDRNVTVDGDSGTE